MNREEIITIVIHPDYNSSSSNPLIGMWFKKLPVVGGKLDVSHSFITEHCYYITQMRALHTFLVREYNREINI